MTSFITFTLFSIQDGVHANYNPSPAREKSLFKSSIPAPHPPSGKTSCTASYAIKQTALFMSYNPSSNLIQLQQSISGQNGDAYENRSPIVTELCELIGHLLQLILLLRADSGSFLIVYISESFCISSVNPFSCANFHY